MNTSKDYANSPTGGWLTGDPATVCYLFISAKSGCHAILVHQLYSVTVVKTPLMFVEVF